MTAHNWQLGEYLLGRPIGHGEFGIVYDATHPRYGSLAVKLILLTGPDSEEKVEAERQGAILQQRFSRAHANSVPQVFEHAQIDGYFAVAMELVRGEPLTTTIAHAPTDSRRAAGIALAIATFLDKAHQFRTEIEGLPEIIVHADLKPAHVLLMPDGGIRVLDFGIAKALAARKPATTNKWGSMQYASPERIESGHVNEHVDFWSLGVMLFELAAGYRPYRQYEGSPSRLESAIRRQDPRAPLPAGVDPGLAAIVHKLLAPQIELRYQSAAAIVQDLGAYLRGDTTVAAGEAARAGLDTVRISSGIPTAAVPLTVPTEPLPRPGRDEPQAPLAPALSPAPTAGAAAPVATPRGVRRLIRNGAKVAAAMVLIGMFAGEANGLAGAARFRDQIPSLEVADVASARQAYAHLREGAPLDLGALRVRRPLRDRMVDLANRTIYEFRADSPALARAEWEQALACLDLAREVAPNDAAVLAKWSYVRGRLTWIRAETRQARNEAIRLLRDSARLDPSSPDPYLALANVYAYSTHDLPALTDAIEQAEQRGYHRGRRERAELGDLHKWLAERTYLKSPRLEGEARLDQLRSAGDDYAKCIEHLQDLDFGDSEASLLECRRQQRAITAELDRLTADEGTGWTFPIPRNPTFPGQ